MRTDMKTITIGPRSKYRVLHVEAPCCIVNVHVGLCDDQGREMTRVDVNADGDCYAGDPKWWVEGREGDRGLGLRVIRAS